ncbi:MAG: glutaredoxin family protein [Syntrophotaleaceae bacterium]
MKSMSWVLAVLLFFSSVLQGEAAHLENGRKIFALNDSPQVELYVTSWCSYCKKAIQFFESRGIPHAVYDIEKDTSAARRKEELDPWPGIPFAVINGQKIHGFSEQAYLQALEP